MFVAMNRFKIKNNFADQFESHWRKRESFLGKFSGFQRFRMLRSEAKEEHTEFVSYTEWLNRASFDEWLNSDEIKKSHSKSTFPREGFMGPPEFGGYEACLDEVPGNRSEFRSTWLDNKVEKAFAHELPAQSEIRESSEAKGLPPIQVGAFEGRLLAILAQLSGGKKGLELGTLGGYSASWLLRGMPAEGRLWSFELNEKNAGVAKESLEKAGFGERLRIEVGPALELIEQHRDELKDLDFVFIDADKANYGNYVTACAPLLRKGGLLIADNAYLFGGMNHFEKNLELSRIAENSALRDYNPEQFEGMNSCWSQLSVGSEWSALVLPTGEGLGVALKL